MGTVDFLMSQLTACTDLCIGYNSLSDTGADYEYRDTQTSEDGSLSTEHVRDKPKGARTWTWLVLCNDGTPIAELSKVVDTDQYLQALSFQFTRILFQAIKGPWQIGKITS